MSNYVLISLVYSHNYLGLILKVSKCMGEKKISECISEDSASVLILKTKIQSIFGSLWLHFVFFDVQFLGRMQFA